MVRVLVLCVLLSATHAVAADTVPPGVAPLVRSTLLTLNDALQTGNFSVLHARFAPAFRARSTVADLTLSLAPLLKQRLSLQAVAHLEPVRVQVGKPAPHLLAVSGQYDGPRPMRFAIVYETLPEGLAIASLEVSPLVVTGSVKRAAPPKAVLSHDPAWAMFSKQ